MRRSGVRADRRAVLAGMAGAAIAGKAAASGLLQASDADVSGRWLFSELGQVRLPPEARRISSSGYTGERRFAAAYRLDDSQGEVTAAGARLLEAAAQSGGDRAAALAAIVALESRIRVRTGDGRWFILDEPRKLAGHFGAVGDGRADDTAALQAVIDWHVYWAGSTEQGQVHLGAGTFRTTRALHCPYGAVVGYFRVQLIGEGMALEPGMGGGTTILCDHADEMALNFQSARYGGARDLAIRGLLVGHVERNNLGNANPRLDDLDRDNWADPAIPGTRHRRFSPYAGITIDAYFGQRPDGGYRDVDYPPWLPARDRRQYGHTPSSAVKFERVRIYGFNTALANQPADADGNGDFTALHDCAISHCVYGVSIGNSQSRNVSVNDTQGLFFHTFLTTNKHGSANGRVQGTWKDVAVTNGINLFDIHTTAIAGPIQFDTVYAEHLYRIGHVSGGTWAENALIFNGGQFAFLMHGRDGRGVPLYVLGNPGAPGRGPGGIPLTVRFTGTSFSNFPSVLPLLVGNVTLSGCHLQSQLSAEGSPDAWRRFAFNALAGGLVTLALETRGQRHEIAFSAMHLDNPAERANIIVGEATPHCSRAYCVPHYAPSARAPALPTVEHLPNPQRNTGIDRSGWTGVVLEGRRLRFATAHAEHEADEAGLAPGGILYDLDSGMTFWIVSRSGAPGAYRFVAELQNGYRERGAAISYERPFQPREGTVFAVSGRHYTPTLPLFFDAEAGSPLLRNVSGRDGRPSPAQQEIRDGDRIVASEAQRQWVGPEHSNVAEARPGELRLGGPVTVNLSDQRLSWLRRTAP